MREFFEVVFVLILCVSTFVLGAILLAETPTYQLGQESILLLEQCELPLPREEFCELVAKPKGAE